MTDESTTPQEEHQGQTEEVEQNSLEERIEQLEKECEEFKSLALRKQADFENYQKRAVREQEQQRRYAATGIASDLLEVVDNLERAIEAAQKSGEKGSLVEGVAMVLSQFLDALKRHGVSRMEDLIGKPFDLERHQAVLRQPTDEHPPNSIVAVIKQGYMLHDRVLRPADVSVAALPPKQEAEQEQK